MSLYSSGAQKIFKYDAIKKRDIELGNVCTSFRIVGTKEVSCFGEVDSDARAWRSKHTSCEKFSHE